MSKRVCWGIYREVVYSLNREDDDAAILELTARNLAELGEEVVLMRTEELVEIDRRPQPDLVFLMCQQLHTLETLQTLESRGCPLVNSPRAVRNTYRHRMIPILHGRGPAFPPSRLVRTADNQVSFTGPCWVKRGDVHRTAAEDVVFVEKAASLRQALSALRQRGIRQAIVQEHLPGDLIKFYGIGDPASPGLWFRWFYHRGQEVRKYPFSESALESLAARSACLFGLQVFGGDAIVSPAGEIFLIDLNAWPSFALFREEAAKQMAHFLVARAFPAGQSHLSKGGSAP